MRPTFTAAVAALAMLAVAAHPADAPGYHLDPEDPESIFFAESQAWFTPTSTVVGNIDHESDEWIGWSADAPTDPIGGVTVATAVSGLRSLAGDDEYDRGQFTAEGSFTGYLDSLTLELYWTGPTEAALGCGMDLAVDLDLDGIRVLNMDGISGNVPVSVEPAGNGSVTRITITNIFARLDSYGSATRSYTGDADTEHVVSLSLQQYPLCQEAIWQYGTADTPSNIIFNRDPADPSVASYTTFDVMNPPAAG